MSKNIILYDVAEVREDLLPLTFTRPIANIRFGILTIAEKWQRAIDAQFSFATADYLSVKYPLNEINSETDIYIAGHICPNAQLVDAILSLAPGEGLTQGGTLIAHCGKKTGSCKEFEGSILKIEKLSDIFMLNESAFNADFDVVTAGRTSQPLSDTCTVIGDRSKIFIEPGATLEAVTLNVKNGAVYIGPNAEIMEGTCVRGPLALCEHATINMGSKIYGATTIGPWCKVGGEINNVVMIGYSNKGHDGFLGNAVIGEWCNLGANCVSSNLKNDYSEVKQWNYRESRFLRTGLQFCGLVMGDHTKAGINTMFNTATVVGVGCNIFGAGFPRTFIASFSEGGASGFIDGPPTKFFAIARRVMARRHVELTDADIDIFNAIYAIVDKYK
jgi:UDP-N-acetylglucosamine diphosphorylase/glucosamine-1-phosphate N-acetyltransferase